MYPNMAFADVERSVEALAVHDRAGVYKMLMVRMLKKLTNTRMEYSKGNRYRNVSRPYWTVCEVK